MPEVALEEAEFEVETGGAKESGSGLWSWLVSCLFEFECVFCPDVLLQLRELHLGEAMVDLGMKT